MKVHYLIFDLDLGVKVKQNVAQCPLHYVTYAPTEFEVTTSKALGMKHLQENPMYWTTFRVTLTPRSHEMLSSTLYIM